MVWKISRNCCLKCGACVSVCPVLAIELKESEGIINDRSKCTLCTKCSKVCPVGAIKVEKNDNNK
jgi:ferredoxin